MPTPDYRICIVNDAANKILLPLYPAEILYIILTMHIPESRRYIIKLSHSLLPNRYCRLYWQCPLPSIPNIDDYLLLPVHRKEIAHYTGNAYFQLLKTCCTCYWQLFPPSRISKRYWTLAMLTTGYQRYIVQFSPFLISKRYCTLYWNDHCWIL